MRALKGYESPSYELYPVYGLVWLPIWMVLYQLANEETGMSNTLYDITSNTGCTLETRHTWIVNEQRQVKLPSKISLSYLFLTHVSCVCACLKSMCTFVGTYVHFSSSPTWENMSKLTNFLLTGAGQRNMCFPLKGGFETTASSLLNVAFLLEKWWLTSRGKSKAEKEKAGRKEGIIEKKIAGEGRHQEVGGRRKKEKGYIATHASTYQLISSEFLSSFKHSPKVDCGKQETNKTVRNSGKGPELKHMTSFIDITPERER